MRKPALFLSLGLFCSLLLGGIAVPAAHAQDGPPPYIMDAIEAIRTVLEASDAQSANHFIDTKLSPALVESLSRDTLLATIARMRPAIRGANGIGVERLDDALHMIFEGPKHTTIAFNVADAPPHHLTLFSLYAISDGPPALGIPTSASEAYEVRAMALERLAFLKNDADLLTFADEHLTPAFVNARSEADLLGLLKQIQQAAAAAGGIELNRTPYGMVIGLRGPTSVDVVFDVESDAPYRIATLQVVEVANEQPKANPVTWASLEDHIEDAVQEGYAGTVLVVRNDEPVLHKGYGFANRTSRTPNGTTTMFDIGSAPIFFTKAAVLLLAQQGHLSLDAPISTYVSNVPDDKQAMTIQHLMTSTSGLPNFHHRVGVDDDYDLAYIDRDEAIRRILEQPLLFAPGEGEAHSHSAWTFLAAIVEIVSGDAYFDFLNEHFFAPAGMTRTILYGPNARFSEADMAVGYGSSQASRPNTPLNWGPTSWLIMGSGGMVSTPSDLHKWVRYVRDSGVLNDASLDQYWGGRMVLGGSDRGFFFAYSEGPNATIFVSTNTQVEPDDAAEQLARDLIAFSRQD